MNEFRENIRKFLPFLEDLRHRLYRGAVLFAVVFAAGFSVAGLVMKEILRFIKIDEVIIAASSPFQFVHVAMDVGFFLAIVVCVPYIIYSFYVFIAPALTVKERKKLVRSVPISVGLFAVGFMYGFSILYYALQLLAAINTSLGIANFWNVGQFLSEIFVTSALLGLIFEFPLLLTLLIRLGVMKVETLKNKRRIAYFIIFCFTALLPPTDGLSLIAMTVPLVLLYEVTVLLNNKKDYVWIRTEGTDHIGTDSGVALRSEEDTAISA